MLASGTAKYGRPKARMPRLSMVSSSGVRASSTMLPMPTEVRAPSASSSCCSRSGSRDKVITSAARGTSTTSTASGACGARGRTIPTYSRAAQVKMIATKRKNHGPLCILLLNGPWFFLFVLEGGPGEDDRHEEEEPWTIEQQDARRDDRRADGGGQQALRRGGRGGAGRVADVFHGGPGGQ